MNETKDKLKWNSPIVITLLTAVVGIIGTSAGSVFQGYHENVLARQKSESALIFEALKPKDPQERAKYLKFLVDAGLVDSLDITKLKKLIDDPNLIPGLSPKLEIASGKDILSSKYSEAGGISATVKNTWISFPKDSKNAVALSRLYQSGRVIAFGHDDALEPKDMLKKSLNWLSDDGKNKSIAFTSGHCEWVPVRLSKDSKDHLYGKLSSWNYQVKEIPNVINEKDLRDVGVLVIGNAWGDISDQEINVIEQFVTNGGGLFLTGLGWSWKEYSINNELQCEGQNDRQEPGRLYTYPMNRVVQPFGASWNEVIIKK
jgi:hypothetical protein